MGAATVSRTVWAFAPGYDAVTSTVGGVISGYCAMGSEGIATRPAMVMRIESTEAKIGLSMKKNEIMAAFPHVPNRLIRQLLPASLKQRDARPRKARASRRPAGFS